VIFDDLIQTASSLPTMDTSALETSIAALEAAISTLEKELAFLERSLPWEYWVYVFTSFVVLGVVMELWIIRHDWRDEMETWALTHFGLIRAPSRPSPIKLTVEIGSVVLIAIGVMGELAVGVRIAYIDGQIRSKSAQLRNKNAKLRSNSDSLLAPAGGRCGSSRRIQNMCLRH
jgi:hypothetical protein